ncbi:MAG TPA: RES domain-containing protein [Burkholderiales bacterium]|nr:RES domain-containing protein [Burkholderiales bacterium]
MKLWRIAAETRKYAADDLSGGGAAARPGRWNDEKEAVVYCAPTIAMAVLETAAHIDDAGLPLNKYLVEIDVPDDIWGKREEVDATSLPPTWAAIPAGRGSVTFGLNWLASLRSPILLVPSVVVPEEPIALINPAHADAARISAKVVRLFEYNRLFQS